MLMFSRHFAAQWFALLYLEHGAQMIEIYAKDWMDPDGVIVASGERLARRLLPSLRAGESMLIKTQGLEGVSSSYFNILLAIVRDELGPDALRRISFECPSSIQRAMVDRSIQAASNFPMSQSG